MVGSSGRERTVEKVNGSRGCGKLFKIDEQGQKGEEDGRAVGFGGEEAWLDLSQRRKRERFLQHQKKHHHYTLLHTTTTTLSIHPPAITLVANTRLADRRHFIVRQLELPRLLPISLPS
jgi:hypothetical protein